MNRADACLKQGPGKPLAQGKTSVLIEIRQHLLRDVRVG